jgi:hypothetical protein
LHTRALLEVDMRKEDRIRQQQGDRQEPGTDRNRQPEPRERERMTGSGASKQPQQNPTQRQSGRLPLPD